MRSSTSTASTRARSPRRPAPRSFAQRCPLRFPEHGLPPEEVVDELATALDGGVLGSTGGRFFGWVIGGALPAAVAADWLTAAWDQNAAIYATSPAASVVEERCGEWLRELLALPPRRRSPSSPAARWRT